MGGIIGVGWNEENGFGTALHWACYGGNQDIVDTLLSGGCSFLKRHNGRLPQHFVSIEISDFKKYIEYRTRYEEECKVDWEERCTELTDENENLRAKLKSLLSVIETLENI